MKRLLIITFITVLFVSLNVFAQEAKEKHTIEENKVLNDIVFWAGQSFSNNGTVNNDIFSAGQIIKHKGIVKGDVFAAGQFISVNGNVDGNVRAAGQYINIKGKIDRNVLSFGYEINLQQEALVNGTLTATGDSININGTINKTLHASGNDVVIDGIVSEDAYIQAKNIKITPNAKINGNLNYTSSKEADIAPGVVSGEVKKSIVPKTANGPVQVEKENNIVSLIFLKFLWFAGSLLLGALLIYLFTNFFKKSAYSIKDSWGKYLGIGFLGFIVVPVAFIILLITIVGIPIALVSLALYLLLLYIAKIPVSIFIGDLILKDKNIYLKLLLGLLILTVVYLIPYIGNLISFIVILIGLGTLVYNLFFSKTKIKEL